MLPSTTDLSSSPLLPETLKKLIISRAPGNSLSVTMIDNQPLRNGKEAEIASSWLSAGELQQMQNYGFEKRRTEWFSGRICVKQAVLNLLNGKNTEGALQPRDIIIENSPSGRPRLQVNDPHHPTSEIDISISHSHGRAVGLATDHGFCGIDIQHLNNTLFKVKRRYCTDIEAVILDGIPADELVQLGLLWVAKEAVRKCLSVIKLAGFHEMNLEQVSEEQGHHLLYFQPDPAFAEAGPITVATNFDGPYAIAVCTVSRERLHAGTA